MEALRKKLLQYMKEQKISQSELARRVGVTRQSANQWFTGKANPKIEVLEKIAVVLNCSLSDLIDDSSTAEEERLVALFRQVPPEYRQMVFDLVKSAIEQAGRLRGKSPGPSCQK